MHKSKFLFLLIGICLFFPALAVAEKNDLYSDEFYACMEKEKGNSHPTCWAGESDIQNKRLNTLYKKVIQNYQNAIDMNSGDTNFYRSQMQKFKNTQRAWIKFRDAYCDYIRDDFQGGTGAGDAHASCLIETTALRVKQLKDYFGNR